MGSREKSISADNGFIWSQETRKSGYNIILFNDMFIFPCQINFLKSVPLLSELPHTVLTKLGDVLESEQFSTGDYIIREGTVGDTFYILASGKDSLYIGKDPEL